MSNEELNSRERKELELRRQCNEFIISLETIISETHDLMLWRADNELETEERVDERLEAIKSMNTSLRDLTKPIRDLDVFSFRRGLIS
jgi:hypothetical protein|nr:MAG TPA: hypothetical protein [Caudoviricetes sp.]